MAGLKAHSVEARESATSALRSGTGNPCMRTSYSLRQAGKPDSGLSILGHRQRLLNFPASTTGRIVRTHRLRLLLEPVGVHSLLGSPCASGVVVDRRKRASRGRLGVDERKGLLERGVLEAIEIEAELLSS